VFTLSPVAYNAILYKYKLYDKMWHFSMSVQHSFYSETDQGHN